MTTALLVIDAQNVYTRKPSELWCEDTGTTIRKINKLIEACDVDLAAQPPSLDSVLSGDVAALARAITVLEEGRSPTSKLAPPKWNTTSG